MTSASMWLGILVAFATLPAVGTETQPADVIQGTADQLIAALDGRREALKSQPEELYRIVDEILLPGFDVVYAGRLVLGKYGRDASKEQRQRFIEAFYRSLVKTYADGLLEFTSERVKILPYRGAPDEDKTTVNTEITLDDGTRVPVDYRLRRTDDGWRVYDVIIEGISYLVNYRKMAAERIRSDGLDAFIDELETKGLPDVER